MIWPDFVDESDSSLPQDQPLPVGVNLKACMFVAVDEMREKQHRAHIEVGLKFYCHEGNRRVAEGIVTKITGLFDERPPV